MLFRSGEIYRRHCLLTIFLKEVARVPERMAEENACRMEHILDQEVVEGISRFMEERESFSSTSDAGRTLSEEDS